MYLLPALCSYRININMLTFNFFGGEIKQTGTESNFK